MTRLIPRFVKSRTGVVLLRNADHGRTDLPRAAQQLLATLVAAGKP